MNPELSINIDECGCTRIADRNSLIDLTNEDMKELIKLWIEAVKLTH